MIELTNVYKRYKGPAPQRWVLRNLTLTFPTGISVGILGGNGAGKSTLLKLIGGLDEPDQGTIVRNTNVSWPIGLAGGFQGSMTGRQNVRFVARIHGHEKNIPEIISFVENFAEIGEAFDRPVKTYSSGMRSRLAFGLSFAFNFDVYLSDEATAVGDRNFRQKATQLFREKIGESSLIIVSHSETILTDLCHAGIWLNDGNATWYDDIKDAIAAYHNEQ